MLINKQSWHYRLMDSSQLVGVLPTTLPEYLITLLGVSMIWLLTLSLLAGIALMVGIIVAVAIMISFNINVIVGILLLVILSIIVLWLIAPQLPKKYQKRLAITYYYNVQNKKL